MQLELVKKDVKTIVDEALTPDIRRFLPTLIKKLDDLNNFSSKLEQLYKEVDKLRLEHEERMDRMQEEWNDRFLRAGDSSTQSFLEIKSMIQTEVRKVEQKSE